MANDEENNNQQELDNVIEFPSSVKVQIVIKDDGSGGWSTHTYPGYGDVVHEVDVNVDKETLDMFNLKPKNVMGKALSISKRAYEGYNYYVDRQLGIILTIFSDGHDLSVEEIVPFDFYNPEGLEVEVFHQPGAEDT
ncbi:hypothetical protein ABID56_002595 [Alkalibacillus flavidus]|uniref:Uncharacterized protein n=1 Tax=Alkalibacillus flavidus TaxID=546021 RepID=A0ABV2KXY7_9BACI